MVGSGGEEPGGHIRPLIHGRDRKRVLTPKMVKERTLRHAGPGAQFVNGRCGIALLTDDREGRIEKLAARTARR